MPWDALRGYGSAPVVSLTPGLSDFVDLIAYTHRTNEHRLSLDNQIPRGFEVRPINANGDFLVTLSVVADNATTVTKHLHYTLSREDLFSDLRFEDGSPDDYSSLDLLADIRHLLEQQHTSATDE